MFHAVKFAVLLFLAVQLSGQTQTPVYGQNSNVTPGGNVPACAKYTKTFADLTDADTEEDEVLFNLPALGKLTGVEVRHSLAFSGGTLSAMTVELGESVTPDDDLYVPAFDIFAAASATNLQDQDMFLSPTSAASDVIARFTATGDNMDNVTAGSVDFRVCWVVLP